MSEKVIPGRFTAVPSRDEITVFLIGMRANRWWKIARVFQVASAMPKILRHLATHPDSGLLGYHQWFGRTTILLSYWESPEHVNRFAADQDAPHLEPWRKFMKSFSGSGDVGIWHETYRVRRGDFETIYADMPRFGLGKATRAEHIGAGTQTARERMSSKKGESE